MGINIVTNEEKIHAIKTHQRPGVSAVSNLGDLTSGCGWNNPFELAICVGGEIVPFFPTNSGKASCSPLGLAFGIGEW